MRLLTEVSVDLFTALKKVQILEKEIEKLNSKLKNSHPVSTSSIEAMKQGVR